jgi:hypothetical protein
MWNPNNPFLYDIMAMEGAELQEPGPSGLQVPSLPVNAAQQQSYLTSSATGTHNIKLPEFWPHAPAMWFARAECRFEMLSVVSERQRFCCVADALPYETLRLVADLVATPPEDNPYSTLKERLLLAHAMSATQRAEKLFSMPPLGGRRPSDLLAAMYEYCPAGEEKSQLFKALFLTRLPPEIRVLLEPEEFADLKQLATRADQLWLTLAARQFAATATVQPDALVSEEDADTVAAVAGRRQRFQRKKQKAADAPGSAGGPSSAAAAAGSAAGGSGKQSVALTICWKHARFGSKAFSCADAGTCQWPEN